MSPLSPLLLLLALALSLSLSLSLLASPSAGQAVSAPPLTLTFEYSHPTAAAAPIASSPSPVPSVPDPLLPQTGGLLSPSTAPPFPLHSALLQADSNASSPSPSDTRHSPHFNLTADVIPISSLSSPSPSPHLSLPSSPIASNASSLSHSARLSPSAAAAGLGNSTGRLNRTQSTARERMEGDDAGEQALPQEVHAQNTTHPGHTNRCQWAQPQPQVQTVRVGGDEVVVG